MRLTFLGTGTSFGIPQVGCSCGVCTSSDPRDKRTRSGAVLQAGHGSILIDTPPELRLQLVATGIHQVDAVLYTHEHADHTNGIDDLRIFSVRARRALPIYGPPETLVRLQSTFRYIFDTEMRAYEGTSKPQLELHPIESGQVIDIAGQPVPLTTRFDAVVDGTNGNTWLERVEAKLRDTTILARGAVVRAREVKGREIAVDVTIQGGRLEDLMALAVRSAKPPVTGAVTIKTRLVIPAGEEDVVDKLQLAGAFELASARFTNLDVQGRVNTLSRRGRGNAAAERGNEGESVVSKLRGRFVMRHASIRFSELTFAVPGAIVQLAGVYNLRSEAIDFAGNLLLDATLAQMTTGLRSVAARIAQPLFRRPGGGSKLPIRISGTRSKPSFGLDIKRALLPG